MTLHHPLKTLLFISLFLSLILTGHAQKKPKIKVVREEKGAGAYDTGNTVNKIKDGEWLSYNRFGEVTDKFMYEMGAIVRHQIFDDEKIAKETHYKDGKEHGKYTEYHDDGEFHVTGEYANGLKVGLWTTYHNKKPFSQEKYSADGQTRVDVVYRSWTSEDDFELVHEKPEKLLNEEWVLHGTSKTFYSLNRIKSEYYYENGKAEGQYKHYFEDGLVSSTGTYKNDIQVGTKTKWYPGPERQKKEEGEMLYVKEGTTSWTGYHGKVTEWNKNGTLKRLSNYVEDDLQGEQLRYNSDGVLMELITWKDDEWHGKHVTYYKGTDQISLEEYYENSKRHGPLKKYYEDGTLKKTGQYYKGARDGEFVFYEEDGSIEKKEKWNRGKRVLD